MHGDLRTGIDVIDDGIALRCVEILRPIQDPVHVGGPIVRLHPEGLRCLPSGGEKAAHVGPLQLEEVQDQPRVGKLFDRDEGLHPIDLVTGPHDARRPRTGIRWSQDRLDPSEVRVRHGVEGVGHR